MLLLDCPESEKPNGRAVAALFRRHAARPMFGSTLVAKQRRWRPYKPQPTRFHTDAEHGDPDEPLWLDYAAVGVLVHRLASALDSFEGGVRGAIVINSEPRVEVAMLDLAATLRHNMNVILISFANRICQ